MAWGGSSTLTSDPPPILCPLSSVRGLGLSPDSHTRLAADGNSWSRWNKRTSGPREAGWGRRAQVKGGILAGARDFQEMTLVLLRSALWSQPDRRAKAKGRAGASSQVRASARSCGPVPGTRRGSLYMPPCLSICSSGDKRPWTAGGSGPLRGPPFPLERGTGPRMKC